MKTTKKIILSLVHLCIFVVTVIMTLRGVFRGAAAGQLGENMINLGFFKAFTVDSNDLAGIASLISAIFLIKSLITKQDQMPYWVVLLQYASAVAVALTFITTATFLAPTQVSLGNSYFLYFSGDMFFLHFSTPVMAILAYIFGHDTYSFGKKENFISLIPLGLYAIVYVTCVIFLETWSDFYGFTFGGHKILAIPVILIITIVTFLMGLGMRKAHSKLIEK